MMIKNKMERKSFVNCYELLLLLLLKKVDNARLRESD